MIEEGEGVVRPCPLDVEKGWKYITVSKNNLIILTDI